MTWVSANADAQVYPISPQVAAYLLQKRFPVLAKDSSALIRPGMGLLEGLSQQIGGDVSVDLSSGNGGMSQHFLDCP